MILFLDFDGVLHSNIQRGEDFCRIPLLWHILRSCPHVNVVFSTSWREIYHMDELVEFVTHGGGEDLALRFISINPIYKGRKKLGERYIECLNWLKENGYRRHKWLAIDDMPTLFPNSSRNLYVVNGQTGLTNDDALKIIDALNKTTQYQENTLNTSRLS